MKKISPITAGVVIGAVLVAIDQLQEGDDGAGDMLESIITTVQEVTGVGWTAAKIPAAYSELIAKTEAANGLPENMLARLLWQESRYNANAKSPAGALGIAQFMPATAKDMGIDPLNPGQAIPAAGRYLRSLFDRFGQWDQALAAYNWGMGNVARKGLANAPAETKNYFAQIMSDLGLT